MTQLSEPIGGHEVGGELIAGALGVPADQLNTFSLDGDQVGPFLDDPAATMLNSLGAIPARAGFPHTSMETEGPVEVRTHVESVPEGGRHLSTLSVARTVVTDTGAHRSFGARHVVRSTYDGTGEFGVEDLGTVPLSGPDATFLCTQARRWDLARTHRA